MKTEIQHFTEAPNNQYFAEVKVSKNDNVYGVTFGNVVREYLKTAYSKGDTKAEVISFGIIYKVLRREKVTVFYDTDGNTLFDVENSRLEQEYGYVTKEDKTVAGSEEEIDNTGETEEKSTDLGKEEAGKEAGEVQEEKPEEVAGEDISAHDVEPEPADPSAVKQMAKEKLEKEIKDAKDKTFAEPVIGHLLKRCEEDDGLAQDVMQEHKIWDKCYKYIFEQAQKQAKGNQAAVRENVVYEWAEDYYRKDDKAEEEKKAKEAAVRKKKEEERRKKVAEKKRADKKNVKQDVKKEDKVEEKTKDQPKSKKNPKEMDGQMDLFSMMGM